MPRPLSADARDKMLRAAQTIVRERGLDAFTVDAVASESGVAKTTIYRHFDSSNELLLAALSDTVGEVPDIDTGDPRADLIEVLRQYASMASQPGLHQLLTAVMQRAATDDDFGRLHQGLIAERKLPLRLAIQRAIACGMIDPTIDIDLVAALLEGPLIARVMHDRGEFRAGEIEVLVNLVLRAVAPADQPVG
jgi:AcrR family transcriptional regulator